MGDVHRVDRRAEPVVKPLRQGYNPFMFIIASTMLKSDHSYHGLGRNYLEQIKQGSIPALFFKTTIKTWAYRHVQPAA